jgi:hypothetical protein
MTLTGMSAADKNAVSSLFESFDNKGGLNSAAAHNTHYANVWCIFFTGSAGEISPCIGTPVT